jgi:hypothetical protein
MIREAKFTGVRCLQKSSPSTGSGLKAVEGVCLRLLEGSKHSSVFFNGLLILDNPV